MVPGPWPGWGRVLEDRPFDQVWSRGCWTQERGLPSNIEFPQADWSFQGARVTPLPWGYRSGNSKFDSTDWFYPVRSAWKQSRPDPGAVAPLFCTPGSDTPNCYAIWDLGLCPLTFRSQVKSHLLSSLTSRWKPAHCNALFNSFLAFSPVHICLVYIHLFTFLCVFLWYQWTEIRVPVCLCPRHLE